MDGEAVGHFACCVESLSRAIGLPWDRTTLRYYRLIESIWRDGVLKQVKAAREKAKEEAKKRGRN